LHPKGQNKAQSHVHNRKYPHWHRTNQEGPNPSSETLCDDFAVCTKTRESPHKADIPLLKQAAESFVPGMNKRDDATEAENMSSPFEKQLYDHKQVTQDMLRVKVPTYFADSPSDGNMIEVHVQDDSPISDITPISKSIIYEEDARQSD
jgi:hypothetical protein